MMKLMALLVATAAAQTFPPTTISPVTWLNTALSIPHAIDEAAIIALVQAKTGELGITDYQHSDLMEKMAKYIVISLDLDDNKLSQMKWQTTITQGQGTLKICGITATINNRDVSITTACMTATQVIPTFYETKQACSHSGSRRYGFCGPRSMKCNSYQVVRGLTNNEVNLINQRLIAKIDENKHLIEQ